MPTPFEPALVVSGSNKRIHPAELVTETRCRSLKVTIRKNEVFSVKERMDLKQITIYRLSSSSYSTTTDFIALNQRKLKLPQEVYEACNKQDLNNSQTSAWAAQRKSRTHKPFVGQVLIINPQDVQHFEQIQ